MDPMSTNTHWIMSRLAAYADQPALVERGAQISYSALHGTVTTWIKTLHDRGIRAGECVAISGDYSTEVCGLLIALIMNRNVVVPLSPQASAQHERFMQIAHVDWIIRFEDGRFDGLLRRPAQQTEAPPLLVRLRERGCSGLVLFSSGSTGESKAAVHDFDLLLEKFKRTRRSYRTAVFLLLDHIGGVNTLFHVLCSGGAVVLLGDRRAEAVCRAIEEHAVELLPTTPTFLRMLLISEAHQRYDLSSLKLITYGTEPMPASTLEHLHRVFPEVELKQTYGLSELGILQTKSRDPASLWVRVGGDGYEVKIVDRILWIKAKTAMLGYLNAPSPFDEEGWFNTGDLVEVDGEYVRILGRKSEIINVGGEKVYPAEVESVLLEMDNVADATVSGKPSPVTGQVVVAKVVLWAPERREELLRRMRNHCMGRLAPYKIPVTVEITEEPLHGDRFKKVRMEWPRVQ